MHNLATALLKSSLWQFKDDTKRGPKPFYFARNWTARGHGVSGGEVFQAGGKVNSNALYEERKEVEDILLDLCPHVCQLLKKYRPDITNLFQNYTENDPDFLFGYFHLFMAAQGLSTMHKDSNDLISFMFVIKQKEEAGGELEVGGTNKAIAWEVGDGIFMDTADLFHGSRQFEGPEEERLVGLFIIQKPFMRVKKLLPRARPKCKKPL